VVALDFQGGLVGRDLAEDVANGDLVALVLAPLLDGGDFDRFAEFRKRDFLNHGYLLATFALRAF
jgi:hypothetical protein